jgi:hypothetical protein
MKIKILLRIASGLMLLHTVGHSIGAINWKNAPTKAIQSIVDGMQTNKFMFMGRMLSIGGFYEGYGLSIIFVLVMVTVLLWTIAAEADKYPIFAAKLIAPVLLFLVALFIIEWIYFFPFATVISLLAASCTGTALYFILKENKLI